MAQAEWAEDPVDQAELGVKQGELPHQGRGGRHDKKLADDQRAQQAAAEDLAVERNRDTETEQQR